MQKPLPQILELARERQIEQEEFSAFVERLRVLLATWEIPSGGRREALGDYLDRRAAAGSAAADEQPVVDALSRQILEALGYRDETWREQAADVRRASESLVEVLRDLIEQFAEDVLHQLDEGLRRHSVYEEARAKVGPGEAAARLRRDVEFRHTSFDLGKEEFESVLLIPLDEWCQRPRLEGLEEQLKVWVSSLEPHVKVASETPAAPKRSSSWRRRLPATRARAARETARRTENESSSRT